MLRTPDVLGPMTPDAVISCRGEEGGLQTPSLLARLSEAHRRNDRSLDAPLTTGDDGFHNCGGGSRHIGEVGHLGKRLDRLDDLDPQDVAASGIDRVHPSGESGGLEGRRPPGDPAFPGFADAPTTATERGSKMGVRGWLTILASTSGAPAAGGEWSNARSGAAAGFAAACVAGSAGRQTPR